MSAWHNYAAHVSQKNDTLWLAITLTYMNRFW